MMKQFMHALLCLCLLLPIGAKAEEFSDVFVFGDSLSDTGNLAGFIDLQFGIVDVPLPEVFPIGLCNPVDIVTQKGCADLFFRQSRVSNGPVAVEILAERLGFDGSKPSLFFLPVPPLGTNYAVAGAKAAEFGLEDFNTQVAAFLQDVFFFPALFEERSEALYVIIIGGNDVIEAGKAAADLLKGEDLEPEERPKAIIDAAVNAIGDRINDLIIFAGARTFLVANSPNIGSLPATRMRAEEDGIPPALLRFFATLLTIKFNKQLEERLEQIRAEQMGSSVEIKEFNLFRVFEGIRFVGKLFGVFENIKDPCFDSEAYRDDNDGDIAERIFHPDCGVDEFDDFVFFDAIHPTGRVHKFVGDALFDVVD